MDAGLVLQVFVVGVAAGAVYGLVATGFSLVYRLTSVLQFAHGDLAGAAGLIGIVAAAGVGPVAGANVHGARYVLGVVVAIAVGATASALLYVAVVRPFFHQGFAIGLVAGTAAVAFAVQGVLAAFFPREAYVLPDPFPRSGSTIELPGGAVLRGRVFWVLGIALVVALIARFVLTKTVFGSAVSAIASEPTGARAVGLPVDRLLASAFGLAGVLAGIAGIVGTPGGAPVDVQTGAEIGLKGIAAALLGGMLSMDRVFVAAIGVGVLEAAVTSLHVPGVESLSLGPAWRDVAPLVLVVILLAFRAPAHAREPAE